MRLGLRATLLLFLGFLLLMGAVALGVDEWMRSIEETAGRAAVRLVVRDKAVLLSAADLEDGEPRARQRLRERVAAIARGSDLVAALSVVDADGRVVAGTGAGGVVPKPAAIFGDGKPEVKIDREGPTSFFEGGSYVGFLPLERDGALMGYAQFTLRGHGKDLAEAYREARRRLLVLGLLGLFGVGCLGLLLQYQLARGAATIERALDETAPPPSLLSSGDEFSRTLATAARVRKDLMEARRESGRMHQGFSALAQVTNVGVLLARGERGIDFANPRALELLGAADLDPAQATWSQALPALAPLFEAARRGEVAALEAVEFQGPLGKRPLRVEVHGMGGEDQYLILLNDSRVLETLEGEVRLASQLDGLARTYRTVAHELKAPLSAVIIHLDLLRESLVVTEPGDEASKERQKRYVSILGEEFGRLNRSLAQLLTQTTPPTEQQHPFDLVQLTRDLGTLLAPQARRQNVDLALRIPDEKLTLVGYRDRMKQALLNIAVNALEAMPKGGRVAIEVESCSHRAQVRVSDAGDGIDPEILSRIYESDFTTKGNGSGIGLHVARALVEMHGGQIEVESQLGQGTRVTVDLPLVRQS
jgi:signal transduction histidine kinase